MALKAAPEVTTLAKTVLVRTTPGAGLISVALMAQAGAMPQAASHPSSALTQMRTTPASVVVRLAQWLLGEALRNCELVGGQCMRLGRCQDIFALRLAGSGEESLPDRESVELIEARQTLGAPRQLRNSGQQLSGRRQRGMHGTRQLRTAGQARGGHDAVLRVGASCMLFLPHTARILSRGFAAPRVRERVLVGLLHLRDLCLHECPLLGRQVREHGIHLALLTAEE